MTKHSFGTRYPVIFEVNSSLEELKMVKTDLPIPECPHGVKADLGKGLFGCPYCFQEKSAEANKPGAIDLSELDGSRNPKTKPNLVRLR